MRLPIRYGFKLEREVARVVRNDNCSGCGVCAKISDRVVVELDSEGFLRPKVSGFAPTTLDEREARVFRGVCPGVALSPPAADGRSTHPIFGSYVAAWQGWASDPELRKAGSSGGVLSALATWLIDSGRVDSVAGSAMSTVNPTRTVPIRITTREEALASAGSRYAPVANTLLDGHCCAFVGKPCEASARSRLALVSPDGECGHSKPILLSFLCAGTPSQHATDDLTSALGVQSNSVSRLRYRGHGWPGEFVVETFNGQRRSMSYEESWGNSLGRRLQTRCKLCPDGTGEHADIAVGDYWNTDDRGFPSFTEGDGNSVVIARTAAGAALIKSAVESGVLTLSKVSLGDVASVQPLQSSRRKTLAGRLIGRNLAGYRVPRYRGYGLFSHLIANPRANLRAAGGTFARSIGWRA